MVKRPVFYLLLALLAFLVNAIPQRPGFAQEAPCLVLVLTADGPVAPPWPII
jgi:hypothetical protein